MQVTVANCFRKLGIFGPVYGLELPTNNWIHPSINEELDGDALARLRATMWDMVIR
jgi:hypothetical protein